jgi:uncharacterized protein (DUF2249 family)
VTADVFIRATSDDPTLQAQATIRDTIERIRVAFQAKSALVTDLHLGGSERQAAYTGLMDFCANQLDTHLRATDLVLYAAASGATETRLLVRALRIQHRTITRRVHELATAFNTERVAHAAQALAAVLAACLEIELTVLLPALADLPGADLPALVQDMHTLLDGGALDVPEVLDVREIPHGQRHPRIFGIFARLAPGESFALVNNHDPKRLRKEFDATHPAAFTWDYVESGPEQWRVRIGRTPPST